MKLLTITICLTIAVLVGSAGASWSADLQKGLDAYQSRDYATALRECKPLADQENATPQSMLGKMNEYGRGLPQDNEIAIKWYTLSAEQGNAEAQNNLGLVHQYGRSIPHNNEIAAKWYELAANQEFADAQYNLGLMYYTGKGVSFDRDIAYRLWRLAAEQGDAASQLMLSAGHYSGQDIPQDYVKALMWANIVSDSEPDRAFAFQHWTAEQMTPSQIAEAEKLARECIRKNYKGC